MKQRDAAHLAPPKSQPVARLADEGLAVVVITSYLPEVLTLSDRILVAKCGKIVEEIKATDLARDHVGRGPLGACSNNE